jgi:hypothetical protein
MFLITPAPYISKSRATYSVLEALSAARQTEQENLTLEGTRFMPSLHWSLSFASSDLSEFALSEYSFANSI